MKRGVIVFAAAVLLAACEPAGTGDPPKAETPDVVAAPEPVPAPVLPDGFAWSMTASGEGAAIILADSDAETVLHIACLRHDPVFRVIAPEMAPGAAEFLALGIGAAQIEFPRAAIDGVQGVVGDGPIEEATLTLLERAPSLSFFYGRDTLGPYAPPAAGDLAAFVADCRSMIAS